MAQPSLSSRESDVVVRRWPDYIHSHDTNSERLHWLQCVSANYSSICWTTSTIHERGLLVVKYI